MKTNNTLKQYQVGGSYAVSTEPLYPSVIVGALGKSPADAHHNLVASRADEWFALRFDGYLDDYEHEYMRKESE